MGCTVAADRRNSRVSGTTVIQQQHQQLTDRRRMFVHRQPASCKMHHNVTKSISRRLPTPIGRHRHQYLFYNPLTFSVSPLHSSPSIKSAPPPPHKFRHPFIPPSLTAHLSIPSLHSPYRTDSTFAPPTPPLSPTNPVYYS